MRLILGQSSKSLEHGHGEHEEHEDCTRRKGSTSENQDSRGEMEMKRKWKLRIFKGIIRIWRVFVLAKFSVWIQVFGLLLD